MLCYVGRIVNFYSNGGYIDTLLSGGLQRIPPAILSAKLLAKLPVKCLVS